MAVGAYPEALQVTAEWWDGRHWHPLSIPSPGGVFDDELSAVSCPSATQCVAVGQGTDKDGDDVPVAATWTRSRGWKSGKPVAPAGTYSDLDGISCPSINVCYAAGAANEYATAAADQLALVERWTPGGGWVQVTLPTLPRATNNMLWAISCASATQCAAVGSYEASARTLHGLIEQFRGSAWRVGMAPKSTDGLLEAVSCPSTSLCVAVGSLEGDHSLAERWSGGTWTAATPPSPATLDGVSCASAAHCVAVGGTDDYKAYVDTLNGTTWTKTAQYGPGFNVGSLDDVSCFSPSAKAVSCAAVGSTPPDGAVPLSALLTGSRWAIVPTA